MAIWSVIWLNPFAKIVQNLGKFLLREPFRSPVVEPNMPGSSGSCVLNKTFFFAVESYAPRGKRNPGEFIFQTVQLLLLFHHQSLLCDKYHFVHPNFCVVIRVS
jgi:hypothetical protein